MADMLAWCPCVTVSVRPVTHGHHAGPSISARGRDGVTHHIVIPIDDVGRQRTVAYLADLTG